MAAAVTYTFVDGTTIEASEHNQNFQDVVDFLNGSTILADGSVAMAADLAMGANQITGLADPTLDQDAATKAYVDATSGGGSHDHDGADITSGTVAADRIASLDASKIGSGTLASARIPSLDASKITTGLLPFARLGTFGTTLPSNDGTYYLGNDTFSWARVYTYAIYDENGIGIIDCSGPVLIGAWTVSGDLLVQGGAEISGAGTTTNNGLPGWRQLSSSDRTLNALVSSRQHKTDIVDADVEESLRIIQSQRIRNFRSLLEADDPEQVMLGLIAEETQSVTPQYADEPDEDGNVAGIGYEGFIVPLIHAVQFLLEERNGCSCSS